MEAALPIPPPGYAAPVRLVYPKAALQVMAISLLLLTTPVLLGVAWLLQGRPAGAPVVTTVEDLGLVLLTILVTVVGHEWIHGFAYQLLGYRVTYGASLKLLAAYAAAFGQWQRRRDNLIVALAPLVVLTLALVPLLGVPNRVVVVVAFTALLFNTSGAVGDLYLAWRLLRLPRGTLLYDVDPTLMLIARPMD